MAASIVDVIAEELRRGSTGDDRYYQKKPYAFVLRAPVFGIAGSEQAQVFPLPINPENFDYTLPFASEITALQEGGVVAEEGGIVIGEISITARMGWKLRKAYDTSVRDGDGEFSPSSLTGGMQAALVPVSGQMLFWRLVNRCFDAYSALKKDPELSRTTRLEFHSGKDDLHLTVIPREFRLMRDAARDRVTYRYEIRCAVVGPAEEVVLPSPDTGLLQGFKNAISKIRSTVQGISAAIDDVTAALDSIRRTITGIASIIDDARRISTSFANMVSGAVSFIDIPTAFVQATARTIETAADLAASEYGTQPALAQSLRKMQDGLERLEAAAIAAGLREPPFDIQVTQYTQTSEGNRPQDSIRSDQQTTMKNEAAEAPGTMTVDKAFGGAVLPGDAARAQINAQPPKELNAAEYSGFEERVVGQGDTLQSLAARHLGNARRWKELAMINKLQPPYITPRSRIPGTLRTGDNIIIPVKNSKVQGTNALTQGDPLAGASQMEKHLGTDFELVQLKNALGSLNGTYGWEIDVPGGATDVHHVTGFLNMAQALEARLRTERKSNILYPNIGLPRIIGTRNLGETVIESQYSARQEVLADSRIERVLEFSFTQEEDRMELNAVVQPVGFTTSRVLSRTIT